MKKSSTGRVGLKKIASVTGVGLVTVHRALSKPDLVAPATRERILRAVNELGYVPDLNASSVLVGSANFLGVIVSSVEQPTFSETIRGVNEIALENGMELLIGQTHYMEEREQSVIRSILGRRPAGVIITFSPAQAPTRRLLKLSNTPIVEVWDEVRKPIDMAVSISSRLAGELVAGHFLAIGRRYPTFVGTDTKRDNERWEGFAKSWLKHAVEAPNRIRLPSFDEDYSLGQIIIDEIVSNYKNTDCLFCTSDITACGALFAAQRRGIQVPSQLAISGNGNLSISKATYPSLTTVDIASYEMGQRAAKFVFAELAGEGPSPRRVTVSPSLLIRESTQTAR